MEEDKNRQWYRICQSFSILEKVTPEEPLKRIINNSYLLFLSSQEITLLQLKRQLFINSVALPGGEVSVVEGCYKFVVGYHQLHSSAEPR